MSEPTQSTDQQPDEPRPFQFGLRSLFVLTFVVAVFCSVYVLFDVVVVLVALIVLCFDRAVAGIGHKRLHRWALPSLCMGCILLLFLFLSLQNVGSRPPTRRSACLNNLKQLGLALLAYEAAHGCFPPAYITDESGRPTHSWRVLILPYMDRKGLYSCYRFDEPWDGPNNAKLNVLLRVFQCPTDMKRRKRRTPETTTSYVAVVGPNTAWPGEKSLCLEDFTDGPQNTILLVEVADSGIHWMEPRDLHVGQMAPGINPKSGQGISSLHQGGANVVFADGHVEWLREDQITPEQFQALLTPAGGEKVDPWD